MARSCQQIETPVASLPQRLIGTRAGGWGDRGKPWSGSAATCWGLGALDEVLSQTS